MARPQLYLAVPTIPFGCTEYLRDAVVIASPPDQLVVGERWAAAKAAEIISAERAQLDPNYLDTMFVLPFSVEHQLCFEKAPRYQLAGKEFQCCGGDGCGGHSGFCPKENHG